MTTKYYKSKNHINNLISDPYYEALVRIRNTVEIACDQYFQGLGVPKVDLFLITKGVSSPIGRGSDSLPVKIDFDSRSIYLADSSQFGMEPLIMRNFDMVYCYLPSFRGEDADDRHLNQFYHCEAELKGDYEKCMSIAEGLVKNIITSVLKKHSEESNLARLEKNTEVLGKVVSDKFPVVTFDEVEDVLNKNNLGDLIKRKSFGRVLTSEAELKVAEIIGEGIYPVWITKYDRDTVAFYQKPDPKNPERVLNADLVFPSLDGGFGGEIVGSGQRQDDPDEIVISMKRQGIKHIESYEWYINLRKHKKYSSTAGFGLGIERLLAWIFGLNSIIDTAIYPVVKGGKFV